MREAVDLAIDRPALAEIAMEGLGRAGHPDGDPRHLRLQRQALRELRRTSSARASSWREAGYPNGFKVTFNFTNDRLPGDRAVGTSVAQMLARIGLEVQADGQPAAVLFPAPHARRPTPS